MCPACLTSMAFIAACGTTAGGLAAFLVRKFQAKKFRAKPQQESTKPQPES